LATADFATADFAIADLATADFATADFAIADLATADFARAVFATALFAKAVLASALFATADVGSDEEVVVGSGELLAMKAFFITSRLAIKDFFCIFPPKILNSLFPADSHRLTRVILHDTYQKKELRNSAENRAFAGKCRHDWGA
jgi:hypothetical protein